jgi:large subunit ribosomal protein L23
MEIIERPIISEKMSAVTDKLNQYGFIVNKKSNKIQIKEAVEKMYDVEVVSVNTMIYPGKSKSRATKSGYIQGRTKSFKKAIVTLAEGQTIDFYSNI